MNAAPLTLARAALLGLCVLALTSALRAAQYYATPSGAGLKNGSSWSNAYEQSQIQSAANALLAGDTLNLGSGTYSFSIQLQGAGTSSARKTILGVDTGSGLPLVQGSWSETTPSTIPSGSGYAFRFRMPSSGTTAYWTIKDIRVQKYASAVTTVSSGNYSNLLLDNIDADTVRDGFVLSYVNNSTIQNCDVIRHTKKAFRMDDNANYLTFENCTADATGGSSSFQTENFPNGWFIGDDTGLHNLVFIDCVAKNQQYYGQATNSYWNGDGWSSEERASKITYIRCKAFDSHDAGFDDKASEVTYDSCVSIGNKRGYRYWGSSGVMVNSLAAYSKSWGDVDADTGASMPAYGLWVGKSANMTVSQSTFHNAIDEQVYHTAHTDFHGTPGVTTLSDCILSVDGSFSNGPMTSGNVVLNRCKLYNPSTGPDPAPNYVAPSRNWTGLPANAFDSQTYTSPEKGYYQASGVANKAPAVTLTTTVSSGMAPLTVSFTATGSDADGSVASYAWDFGNGSTATGATVTATYSAANLYAVKCTVTDNSGATTTRYVPVHVIKANAGANLYVLPAAAGLQDGSSWANAYGQDDLRALLNAVSAGQTIHLGSGTYTLKPVYQPHTPAPALAITKSGTSAAPIVIQGVDRGTGLPLFDGDFNPVASNARAALFTFGTDAVSYVKVKHIDFREQGFVFDMPLSGTTDTLRRFIDFENLSFDLVEDAIRIRNDSNINIINCRAIRYTKKAFRIGNYSSFVLFENCWADCTGGDPTFKAKAIPNSFAADDTGGLGTIHDITFSGCTARNNGYPQPSSEYWNGDGFATEEGAYNITYLRCVSVNNHDAGFDDKADNVLYQDCVAAGNKRQIRIWRSGAVLDNCVIAHAVKASATGGDGGSGAVRSVWLKENASATIKFSSMHNGTIEALSGSTVSVENSILSSDAATTTFYTGSGVTLTRTVTYSPSVGTDPGYVAPSSTWRGSPVNAYDNTLYGATKGFASSNVEAQTLALQQGTSGYAGTSDTRLVSDRATTNYGSSSTLLLDGEPNVSSLLKFDLSWLARGRTVTGATLTFNVLNASAHTYQIYALKRAWNESTATYQQADTGVAWESVGANGTTSDRETTVLGTLSAGTTGSYTLTLNSSGAAKLQSWIDDPAANLGLVLINFVNSDGLELNSSEATTITARPKLTLTYK